MGKGEERGLKEEFDPEFCYDEDKRHESKGRTSLMCLILPLLGAYRCVRFMVNNQDGMV